MYYALCVYKHSRYAEQRIEALRQANQLRPRSRFANWRPVTIKEFHAFLAIIMNMGLIEIPTLEGYWTTTWESEIPFFRRVMPRDRFLQIFWMLHVGDGPRRVDKVRPLMDALVGNFQTFYSPTQNLAVDETMVGLEVDLGLNSTCPISLQSTASRPSLLPVVNMAIYSTSSCTLVLTHYRRPTQTMHTYHNLQE